MSKSSPRGRRGRGGTPVTEIITRPKQSLPVQLLLIVWRWRWELIMLAALAVIYAQLINTGMSGLLAVLLMAVATAVVFIVPIIGPFIRTRAWCVITRHRLRACMSELRTLNYSGNLPFIVHTHGSRVGESVWLWMRPGLSVTDLEGRAEHVAAACWAREVHITRSRRFAALVRVDTVRRDPLAAKTAITSPLLNGTSKVPTGELTELPESMFAGLTTAASVPTATDKPVHMPVEPERATKKSRTSAATAVADPVVLINGEDVSDYV